MTRGDFDHLWQYHDRGVATYTNGAVQIRGRSHQHHNPMSLRITLNNMEPKSYEYRKNDIDMVVRMPTAKWGMTSRK